MARLTRPPPKRCGLRNVAAPQPAIFHQDSSHYWLQSYVVADGPDHDALGAAIGAIRAQAGVRLVIDGMTVEPNQADLFLWFQSDRVDANFGAARHAR